jgi:ubiquinone/menaquinone biosynthesis C-methylase UbiE
MISKEKSISFSGNIPMNYDEYLDSLFFEPYAKDMAMRVSALQPAKVLEVACGTGIVTKQLLQALPVETSIIATDINPAMLALAEEKIGLTGRVFFQVVDAQSLPFNSESFDCVAGQFGVMFYADKRKAYLEALRVLNRGGTFIFNTWDAMLYNPIIQLVKELLDEYFPVNPPSFYNLPFSYFDTNIIKSDLVNSGFSTITTTHLEVTGVGANAIDTAKGLLEGTPVHADIVERGANLLPELIDALSIKLAKLYGAVNLRVPLRAVLVTATKG